MKPNLENIIFEEFVSIQTVLKRFNLTAVTTGGKGFGLVVDKKGKCIGTISDGDIRRALSKNTLASNIKGIYNKKFSYISETDSNNKVLRLFENSIKKNNKYLIFPVLNKKKKIIDIINYDDFLREKNSPSTVKVKVPIRISFSGGGTDFSDYINKNKSYILSSTIDKSVLVAAQKNNKNKIFIENHSNNKNYVIDFKQLLKKKRDLIENIIFYLKPKFGFKMIIKSDVEPGTGLGGSSALTMAVLTCIKRLQNERIDDHYNLINSAYKLERLISDIKGGWQDYYSCYMGGFNWIEMDKNNNLVSAIKLTKKTILDLESNILLFRFGKKRDSNLIQNKNINYASNNKKKISKYYKYFKENSLKMKKALILNNLGDFSKLLDESWFLKTKVTPHSTNNNIKKIYKNLKKIGTVSGKILGAGNSGYLLVYSDIQNHSKIKKFLERKNFKNISFNFTSKGMEVWES